MYIFLNFLFLMMLIYVVNYGNVYMLHLIGLLKLMDQLVVDLLKILVKKLKKLI